MLRTVSCLASRSSSSLFFRFFRQFPRSYMSLTSSTAALRVPSRNLRRISSPSVAGRRLLLRRGLRIPSAAVRSVNGQFSRLSVRAVATQPAPLYPDVGQDEAEKLGFEKVSEEFISECKSKAILFKHKKTGCEVMSVSNEDENKVFGVVFRTPPKDSTGIPHILEHSVLCGSRKYPVKEPFVELLKGSLHTFLNAFTYPDRTCYPVASTNTKDFYNLVDVYLDAVFFPKCVDDAHTFQQEGWHYELNDPSEDISYKGVVFNEMKGVYSQPDNILGRIAQQALSPENTYGVDSGGDPKDIPNLTFEEFKEFHRQYYHPSNARIWFYGDDDPVHRLRVLSEYLDMFEASPSPNSSKIKFQKLFSEPVRLVEKYPAGRDGDLKKKHMLCVNWLLSEKPLDLQTQLALGFLDHLMLGTPASPLRKILLESGLGEALVSSGLSDELLQPQFGIGLKGVSEENVQKVEELIMDTLKKLAEEGFDNDAVEASMNTIEFSLRENNTGSFPRGLSLMLQSISKWIYDMDPFEPLKYTEPLKALKTRIAEEGSKAVFSPLIEKLILNNSHRVTIEMQPDPEKATQEEVEEKNILEKVKAAMTEEDLAELARATEELKLKQETPDPPEALRCVPSLNLGDIPKEPTYVPTEVGDINGVKVLRHDLFTNDIIYTEVVFDIGSLKHELLPLVPLFCQSLLEMGTKDLTFVQLNQLIGRKTGGISVYPLTSSVRGKDEPCSKIIVRGKSMAGRADDLFNLMNCLLQEVQFTDQQRFKQFVSQSRARMENRLRGSGHGIAAARMDAMLNIAGWMSEQMGGLSYLEFLHTLEKKVDEDWEGISSSLEEIRRSLLARNGCIVNMTADGKSLTNVEKSVAKFLDLLPENPSGGLVTWDGRLPLRNEAIVIPTQVNYVGKAGNIYSTGYELDGSAYVISKHISNTWLWDRVRVSGGAYGGFCDFDSHSGVFSYLSYRDPNLLKTLDIYDGTGDFLRGLDVDQETLTKAIIGTIGDVDSYQLPDAKGYSSLLRHLLGVTDEERQRKREEILTTSLKDFKDFAQAIDVVRDKGVAVAVASAEDIDAANNERSNFFVAALGSRVSGSAKTSFSGNNAGLKKAAVRAPAARAAPAKETIKCEQQKIKVAINGFGRIGRNFLRCWEGRSSSLLDVVAINDSGGVKQAAHLLKYDSTLGVFSADVKIIDDSHISVNGKSITVVSSRDPTSLPWKAMGIDLVIEGTGVFVDSAGAGKHLTAGAKKVLITAPAKGSDIPTFVMGVNADQYKHEYPIISNASCTTNCLAPFVKVLDEKFGIVKGTMTTTHSYTGDQRLLDASHRDLRRARAAALNIVPTTTGAAKAVALVLPKLKGKLNGIALRVPTPNVSVVDLVIQVEKKTFAEEVNSAFKAAAASPGLTGILAITEEPLVSVDFRCSDVSTTIDASLTMVMGDDMVKVVAWYDNEWGYSQRVVDLAELAAQKWQH